MAWLLDMTRAEKEEFVIRLYKENKSIREIAKLMHMSFGEIGKILKKFKKEAEIERGHIDVEEIDNKAKSKESQAFKLFLEGKTPVEVVIALDLPPGVVRATYREFWEFKGMHKLNVLYAEIEDYLPSLLKLLKIVEEQGMTECEVINVLKLANNNELRDLQEKVEYFRNQIRNLELEKDKCTNDVLVLTRRIDELRETVNAYESSLNEKREEIALLNQELKKLDNLVSTNKDNKINDDSDTEVINASGDWHNVIP